MTDISRVDRLMLQLRTQLQNVAKGARKESGRTGRVDPGPIARLKGRQDRRDPGDGETRRQFVRALLMEELGEEWAGQPEFQDISDRVWQMMESDPQVRDQLTAALGTLLAR